ncbi:MAG: rhodanese-like domain-containing protein [Verrucomicrobiota bacterium]|nr:rhodanese-like domain-containing protein [Verrucomicrobiota bacterium]
MNRVTATELAEMLASEKPPRLLDVRQIEEHQFAALPNSRLIPLHELESRVEELRDWINESIIVYCHHGIRSAHAIGFLQMAGFKELRNLSGGIDAWSIEVDPTLPRY